eukprot:CAMPEP_0170622518 /NCGR_PEP_ID=MMETSP0224-20130122/29176_1 /TAXON_ID=285029 /ORGANISM="Togula jolla, Strain CCCM 725" /LENGTH=206 /DNA_ID=CAMNT_0010948847 /DNA_START=110 /DNA_END=730 /DNA_ORIENTATION=-
MAMITNGHSGAGLIVARELSALDLYPFITTISRRGRPEGLGPESALLEAMVQGNADHYMAKCDVSDPVAFNDLWHWAPAAAPPAPPALLPIDELLSRLRDRRSLWSRQLLKEMSALLQVIVANLQLHLKQARGKSTKSKEQQRMWERMKELLEEREVTATELLADVLALANRQQAPDSPLTEREKIELEDAVNAWAAASGGLAESQ